jgi:hypothetical protein
VEAAVRSPAAIVAVVAMAGCSGNRAGTPRADRDAASPQDPIADATAIKPTAVIGECGDSNRRELLAPGLELLTLVPTRPPAAATADRCMRVVRADPKRYAITVGAAERDGGARTAPAWSAARKSAAVINASMFHHGGESTGQGGISWSTARS